MTKRFFLLFAILLFAALSIITLHAVEVKKIEIDSFADFQAGEFKGTSLDSRGRLFIGPQVKKIDGPRKEYYLSLDIAGNGDIYLGTGHNASIFRVTAQGSEEIFSSDYLDIYALLVTANGDVYAGTAPNGRLYKIGKGKRVSVKNGSDIFYELKDKTAQALEEKDRKNVEVFDPDEKYIWDIKEDIEGNIIFSVGSGGGVYKLDRDGNGSKIFTPEDTHIVNLCISRDNAILAGSGDRGILYRIDKRKVKVLFDSPLDEIKGICEDNEGNIYFAASRGVLSTSTKDSDAAFAPFFKKRQQQKKTAKEKSILYCLHTSGAVEQIWASEEEYIYSAFWDEASGRVIIGTANFGRVYGVKKDGSFAILYESEAAQVFKIAGKKSGFTIITNNTASIAHIGENLNSSGSYLSEIYDMEIQSRLGRIYWDSLSSPGGEVRLFTRAGNSNIPDSTWSDWSAPFTDSENSSINMSGVRYFQVKAVLNAADITKPPYLDNCRIYYIQSNLSPQLKRIEISKPKPKKPAPTDSKDKKKERNRKYLEVRWQAADPNKDKLKFDIFLKKVEHKNWIVLKENFGERKLELKTELFEDGKYQLKIAADDALANSPATAKADSKISAPFIIDSTAPLLENFQASGRQITFRVVDETSIISKVLYSLDGEIWYPIFPKDMLNDSKSEEYSFTLNPKGAAAKKILFIKAADEFDNYKVFQKEI